MRIEELVDKIYDCGEFLSVSLKDNNMTVSNIIDPNELVINDNEISISSGNFIANVQIEGDVRIFKDESEIEEGYILKNKNFELYITLL